MFNYHLLQHKKNLCMALVILSAANLLSSCRLADSSAEKPLIHQSLADMVFVKGGAYMMGPSLKELQGGNMIPVHKVKLDSFHISKYNVSYKKYDLYTKSIGKSDVTQEYKKVFFRASNYPANLLTWSQASDYCNWLAQKTGLPYSLPTEAQWEYVARNGGKDSWTFPTSDGTRKAGINFPSYKQLTSQKSSYHQPGPLPVGSIPCTPMRICGLTGEVNQWMNDWYLESYYSISPINNPKGPQTGKLKAVRGAGMNTDSPQFAHNYQRDGINPKENYAGFRCVINTDMPPEKFKAYIKKFEK